MPVVGGDEVRWIAGFPSDGLGLITHETGSGYLYAKLARDDLAASLIVPPWDGTLHTRDQWLRLELRCDGTDTVLRIYPGHADTDPRVLTWSGQTLSGPVELTGYRYRVRPTLRYGDQGSEVAELQNELIDLGYDLGSWGADGDYGQVTVDAVEQFQTDYGYSLIDGEAGPSTRAGIDLALGGAYPPLWISHVAVSDGPLVGPEPEPVDPTPPARLVAGMPI
ncbi:peptidoglycan-binding domain-containing protein [Salinactinospora qingdaonensis]|uniref:Peptidoglycan binding-like domain-containing protein n=1 Tax=Salinactinospora qingdaonensis TaxID=702744 RepID=A0ABP7FIG3_9ACTN